MSNLRFVLPSLLPLAAIAGYLVGGSAVWSGVVAIFAGWLAVELLAPRDRAPASERLAWFADSVLFLQVPLVVATYGMALVVLAEATGVRSFGLHGAAGYGAGDWGLLAGVWLSLVYVVSLNGTVTAHELIHRTWSPVALWCGRLLLAFSANTHFAVEHVYGHHLTVGTGADPVSAKRGESFYRFVSRAIPGTLRSAWAIERLRLDRRGSPMLSPANRVLQGASLTLTVGIVSTVVAGLPGLALFAATAAMARLNLELTNYVEHYGIVRVPGTPIEDRHSWDAPHLMSGAGMFALGRHGAHHAAGHRPYWALDLSPRSPVAPLGLFPSMLVALVPPLWRRLMARPLASWDAQQASPAERALLPAGPGL